MGNVLSAHRGRQPVNKAKSVVTTQVVRASASACRWSAAQADMRTCVWVDRCTLCQYPSTFVSVLATKRSETFFLLQSWQLVAQILKSARPTAARQQHRAHSPVHQMIVHTTCGSAARVRATHAAHAECLHSDRPTTGRNIANKGPKPLFACQYPNTFVSVLAIKRSETCFCSIVGSWSLKNSNQPAPILQGNCAVRNHLKTIQ